MTERKIRLLQAAKEFKVGLSTITDFLAKKGVKIENSPNTPITSEVFELIEKEFGGNRHTVPPQSIRERMAQHQETVSLKDKNESSKVESGFKDEIVIKTSIIQEPAPQIGPKVLGMMDLSPKPKTEPKIEPKAESKVEVKAEPKIEPKVEVKAEPKIEPKAESKVEVKAEPKIEPKVEVKAEAKIEPKAESKVEVKAEPKIEPKTEIKAEAKIEPKAEIKAEHISTDRPNRPAAAVKTPSVDVVKAEAPVTEPIVVQTKTYDERMAESSSNLFRRGDGENKLEGPKVLGKMDVSALQNDPSRGGRREKRKRITKDKVDVARTQTAGPGGVGPRGTGPGGAGPRGAGPRGTGVAGAAGGPGKPGYKGTAQSSSNDLKGKKKGPKPVVRPEVSEEAVQRQVKETLARLTAKGGKGKGAKYRKDKRDAVSARMHDELEREQKDKLVLKVTEFVTVSELGTMMNAQVTEVIMACMNLGLMVSINQRLDAEALVIIAEEFGYKVEFVSAEIQESIDDSEDADDPANLKPRPPIVTVMGHVDHGKTSLLDNIRKTNVIEGEAGGITQHIGAYSVEVNGQRITFLDTPGHEAFTAMRARGAKITDVAIIIIAADDSVMPQTVEAINHAAAAGVPMVFAINKIDKPGADPERIKDQLAQMNYLVEDWGGKYQSQDVSAKQGLNLDKLLEKVLLEAELLDLNANPNRKASGAVIESTLDKGRGYVTTVLVENGTLRVGDIMLSGTNTGRVKAMYNEHGLKIEQAGPSTPVLVLGLNGAPQAGDTFNIMDDDKSARTIANKREQLQRMQGLRTQKHVTLDEIGRRIAIGSFKELNIIVKGDVDGSIEAMTDSLVRLSKEEVQVNVIHKAVGQISESDVLLAAASNAIIVGFQVRPSQSARKLAEKEEIEIRLYSIIYDAINDIKDAIEGMLEPITKEVIVCSVEVLETFKITRVGTIAGCIVREGKLTRHTAIRIIRDGIVVHTGKLGSLKRYKDDVKEATSGMECGLNIESYNDIQVGDIVEGYEIVEVKR